MKIAILGAGNTGCAIAADYSYRGHDVTLIKTSHSMHDDNFEYLTHHHNFMAMEEFGETRVCRISRTSRDLSLVAEAELVLICTQTVYHESIIKAVSQYLKDGQILMVIPGYLSTAYVLRYCGDKKITVIEAESSFVDGRISEPAHFKVGFRNVCNPLGVYPVADIPLMRERLLPLGTPISYLSSVVEAALHNPNMIVHTVGAVMSIPRIEATGGNYCMYHEVFTPSVWRILEKLDGEKMDILGKLGFDRVPYVEACKFRNSLDTRADAKQVFFDYAAMPTRAKGPLTVDSRYITEDVSQGLVMLESLGVILAVPTPIATALIETASAALGRDLRASGRSIENLGRDTVHAILAEHLK